MSIYRGLSPKEVYKKWHWNTPSTITKEVEIPGGPEEVVETGRLVELHYRPLRSNPKLKDRVWKPTKKESNNSHLVFDPQHKHQRLYIILDPTAEKKIKEKFWKSSKWDSLALEDVAPLIGGKHGTTDYPDIKVKPLGILTALVYATEKDPDGYSFYIHKMGEETHIQPALATDKKGRLWIVGGDYTSPIPGITN